MLTPASDKITTKTRAKLLKLADFIEQDTEFQFYMGELCDESSDGPIVCGTACCIAGYTIILFGDGKNRRLSDGMYYAGDLLGLTSLQARRLFMPQEEAHLECRDRTRGASVLRNFAYTGEPEWSV